MYRHYIGNITTRLISPLFVSRAAQKCVPRALYYSDSGGDAECSPPSATDMPQYCTSGTGSRWHSVRSPPLYPTPLSGARDHRVPRSPRHESQGASVGPLGLSEGSGVSV
ncbi:hypothetical protein E2C01_036761 [Portunus trituberculatus]|uniref:Uncharacterized protein n=1 Tax=Portunus trituberculatus TaxID=210409 RepID=A0A5B7FF76_PORTR|nr:hypothetical protein [Portunus trituberculatus]